MKRISSTEIKVAKIQQIVWKVYRNFKVKGFIMLISYSRPVVSYNGGSAVEIGLMKVLFLPPFSN